MPRATERVGRSGEYLTAALLSQISDTVLIVPHGSEADIVFEHEARLYKVQVKTALFDRDWETIRTVSDI